MSASDAYRNAVDFRRALTDNMKAFCANGHVTMSQLQRHIAYDRLLERMYLVDHNWIVKGATALLARSLTVRGTQDIDVALHQDLTVAIEHLTAAAQLDIGEWFAFDIRRIRISDRGVASISITARLGQPVWCEFRVDLVDGRRVPYDQPEMVPPIARQLIPDSSPAGYFVTALTRHVAEKVAATYERHGAQQRPSTRFRDLADLVSIARGAQLEAKALAASLASEFAYRGMQLPSHFSIPSRELWASGYSRVAREAALLDALTLDDALAEVSALLNPILGGRVSGQWSPLTRQWVDV